MSLQSCPQRIQCLDKQSRSHLYSCPFWERRGGEGEGEGRGGEGEGR